MTPDGILTTDNHILGAIWILPRGGVHVLVSDTMYAGACFSDAIPSNTLRGLPDLDIHWVDQPESPGFLPDPLDPYPHPCYATSNT